MAFSNPITGGQGALVRPAIKSPNYVVGTSGWSINRDGTAEFNDVIVRGELESSNYVPGISGWHLDPNGSAEFYDVTARGDIIAERVTTGTAPNAFIDIYEFGGGAFIDLWSNLGTETAPARIVNNSGSIQLKSADEGSGTNSLLVDPVTGGSPGGLLFQGGAGIQYAELGEINVNILSASPIHVYGPLDVQSSIDVPFGDIQCASMHPQNSTDAGPRTTTGGVAYVVAGNTASITGDFPPSGVLEVSVWADCDNNNAAGLSYVSFEVRQTNAAGALLVAANDLRAGMSQGTLRTVSGRTVVLSGLPTTGTYFVRPMFRINVGADTGTWQDISITAHPCL